MRNTWPNAVAAVLLLAVLPIFGGGQARAGFVAESVSEIECHEDASWESLLAEFLRGDEWSQPRPPAETRGEAPTERPPRPLPKPRDNERHAATGGAGTNPSPSGGAGNTPSVGLVSRVCVTGCTESGQLFLTQSTFRPRRVASRLFRPPRFGEVFLWTKSTSQQN